jgi:two-component system NtrC family sensor kinase
MNAPKERILLVESDPTISDLIARQTLVPLGYRVQIVGAATSALQDAIRFGPDLIIANLTQQGLSGKDLLVAFSSQGLEVPFIVISDEGMESDVIQAFRLGAADFLNHPIREAEVVAAVERILKQVRSQREKEQLSRQLNQTNKELQRRVRELTTIFAIGKAVISITDLRTLLDKIIEGAVYVAEAESGWLLTRDERSNAYNLSAFRNLPRSIAANLNKPWDDGLSALVALSGESLAIHGDPIKRFKIASLGQSALVVPIKVKNEVVGLIVVIRKTPQPFGASSQALLEAVADYASIAVVNARLFRVLEDRVRSSQKAVQHASIGERIANVLSQIAGGELSNSVSSTRNSLDVLLKELTTDQRELSREIMGTLRKNLDTVAEVASTLEKQQTVSDGSNKGHPDLNELARQSVNRFRVAAQINAVSINTELTSSSVHVRANAYHVVNILDCLLSNAVRWSLENSTVNVRVGVLDEKFGHVSVQDQGPGIKEGDQKAIFEAGYQNHSDDVEEEKTDQFAGLGIPLELAHEIVRIYQGRLWVENGSDGGAVFHFTLPLNRV